MKISRRTAWIAACYLAFLSYRAAPSEQAAIPNKKPDVILITIDTLRADRLGCYGYKEIETPSLDALARDGIRFTQAVAECPITLPSHCSILTGTYPLFHGVRDNSGYRLPREQVTLAEILKEHGYRTGAFVGAYIVDSSTGLDQGFDTYVDGFKTSSRIETDLSIAEHPAAQVVTSALSWLRKARAGEKSFAWIHLFDPHAPYAPPAPFSVRYSKNPYDGEVAYVDSALGELLRYMKEQRLYTNSLITAISDHGEGLGDHGEATHGLFLYDSTLRIPWILKPPGSQYAGRVMTAQVQSIDLMPTVLQFLGIQKPATGQGTALLSLLAGKPGPPVRYALGETLLPRDQYGWSPLLSIRTEQRKFIQAPRPELYDLKQDPKETVNLYSGNQGLAAQLKQEWSRLASQYSSSGAAGARLRMKDPTAFQRLLGLGYVAISEPSGAPVDTASLPDPKDRIDVFNLLWAAEEDAENRRFVLAIEKLKKAIGGDPKIYFAHALLGLTYSQMGRYPEAVRALRTALELRPNDSAATFYLGMALARQGQNEAAERAFLQVLEFDPHNDAARNNLGIVYLNQKRYAEATEVYRQLVRATPKDSFFWTNLGLALMGLNRNDEAVDALKQALALDPKLPQIENNLGLALMNTGKIAEAIVHYRRAISLNFDYAQAHYNLALALKKQGLAAESGREMGIARRLLEQQKP